MNETKIFNIVECFLDYKYKRIQVEDTTKMSLEVIEPNHGLQWISGDCTMHDCQKRCRQNYRLCASHDDCLLIEYLKKCNLQ